MSAEMLALFTLAALLLLLLAGTILSALSLAATLRPRTFSVRVAGGYRPQRLQAAPGRPLRIVFDRRENDPCSHEVVFPQLGLHAALPAHQHTDLRLPPLTPGEYRFRCGRGRLQGTLVVASAAPPVHRPATQPRIRWP